MCVALRVFWGGSGMSVVARWHVVCKFGYKQELVTALQVWINTVACKAGVTRDNTRVLTGSVGAKESELQMEVRRMTTMR